jgi:hypothetical protein
VIEAGTGQGADLAAGFSVRTAVRLPHVRLEGFLQVVVVVENVVRAHDHARCTSATHVGSDDLGEKFLPVAHGRTTLAGRLSFRT